MHFIIQSPQAWRDPWQRPHHLARRFAQAGHRVSWISPRYLGWIFTDPGRFVACRRERPEPGIEVAPVTLLNGEFLRYVRIFNQDRLRLEAKSCLRRRGPETGAAEARILWLYNPHEGHLAKSVEHDLLIYDVIDDYPAFPWTPREIESEEDALLRAADWVIAGTHGLYEAKKGRVEAKPGAELMAELETELGAGRETKFTCILSGVETKAFSNARTREIPVDMQRAKKKHQKLIGYAGVIDHRIDAKLLEQTAREHPEWGWVFLGPVRTNLDELRRLPNVYLKGPKPYEALPSYYGGWDAALVPFVDDETTRRVNPTKMLEYAAAGIPIVARDLPEIRQFYADGAWLYENEGQFERALGHILGEDLGQPNEAATSEVAAKVQGAKAWITGRSWDEIAAMILNEIEAKLKPKAIG